jgi:hypothetical protein
MLKFIEDTLHCPRPSEDFFFGGRGLALCDPIKTNPTENFLNILAWAKDPNFPIGSEFLNLTVEARSLYFFDWLVKKGFFGRDEIRRAKALLPEKSLVREALEKLYMDFKD